jgi:hypothetical protein
MDITVCICTHDRPNYLRDCLEGLSRQTAGAESFDIVVVDSASTGDAPARMAALVANIANARLLRVDQAGVSFARNAGAEAARGNYPAMPARKPHAATTSPTSTMTQSRHPTGSSVSRLRSPKSTAPRH